MAATSFEPVIQDGRLYRVSMTAGGDSLEAKAGMVRYSVLNPANGRLVGTAPLCRPKDAEFAVGAAVAALDKWSKLSTEARAELIAPGLDAVERAQTELAPLLTREQGKPLPEASAEISGFVASMRAFLRLACTARNGRVLRFHSARSGTHGPVAEPRACVTVALTAWNFPVGLLAKKLGPALMAGGTVVVKPAYTTPLTTLRVIGLMNVSGLPPGVLNCVTGRGEEIGAVLASHAEVSRVHLTGSNSTGRRVAEAASAARELVLELGGSDPMVVCSDADIENALRAAVIGRYRNAGQICTAVKRLYVDHAIYDRFVGELAAGVCLRQPGDGMVSAEPPRVRMGPLHTAAQRDRIEEQLDDAFRKGAAVLVGGHRPASSDTLHGYFFEPTLVADVAADSKLLTEEVFGPVLPVFRTRSVEDAIAQVNLTPWDLSASVWTRNHRTARAIASRISCRHLWINRLPFGREAAA
jgi:acyl-CoA reductase-like NAD-dependent aldehyde dehydrogenase